MENQSVNGQTLLPDEIRNLLLKLPGFRMKQIRLKLNAMYPGEFTLKSVAKAAKYSESGYAKLESGETINPQDETIRVFSEYFSNYNVPLGFFDKTPVGSVEPFFLGKQEDMLPYFDSYHKEFGQKHPLDSRELSDIDDDYVYSDYAIDVDQDDAEESEDGGYTLNQIGIEVTLNAYQVSTGSILWARRLNQMAAIPMNELSNFEKAVRREVNGVISQYSQMQSLQEQLQDSQTRQRLLEMQVALKEKDQKSDSDSSLERLIGTLLKV
ncbi:hypothetical protein B1748_19900 [Paenibacillus sp. MY03]|uniref:helix-turn-helix domain-containing protein n=1 Tax=Paenibacillus sp. MY03 TaxID=302980 RepID=UPI000B3C5439|nr:helix-turn-helix transcriptional regulator [Paenibacillus sp. MY03]OUS74848.1 hypothetical protein B1748_19900 [Paenibacillus sp. MY03]